MTDQDRQDEYVGSKWFFITMLVIIFSFAFIGRANSQENRMVEGKSYEIFDTLMCDTPDQIRQVLTLTNKYQKTLSDSIKIVNESAQATVCGVFWGEMTHDRFFPQETIRGLTFQIMEVTLTKILSVIGMIPVPPLKLYAFWELAKMERIKA